MILCSEKMQSTVAVDRPWENLQPELLGRIAGMFPNPADRARFRCVCRSWRLVVRHHCPQTTSQPPPWVVLSDGSFLMLSDGERRHLPSAILHYTAWSLSPRGHHMCWLHRRLACPLPTWRRRRHVPAA